MVERAIQEDPSDARSYAGLSQCYIALPFFNLAAEDEAYARARDATAKALELDDSLAEAHLSNAELKFYKDWDFVGAEAEFKKALALSPNYSTAHQWYGEFLSIMARHQEAIREEQTTLTLDPLSTIVHHQAANVLRDAGRYEEALGHYHEALRLNPGFLSSYESMFWSFRRQAKFEESIQALRTMAHRFNASYQLPSRIVPAIDALERAYEDGGSAAYFRQCVVVHRYYVRSAYYLARDYAELGDRDSALAELEHSYRDHDVEALWLFTDPELDAVRADPRFQNLVRRIGFPQ